MIFIWTSFYFDGCKMVVLYHSYQLIVYYCEESRLSFLPSFSFPSFLLPFVLSFDLWICYQSWLMNSHFPQWLIIYYYPYLFWYSNYFLIFHTLVSCVPLKPHVPRHSHVHFVLCSAFFSHFMQGLHKFSLSSFLKFELFTTLKWTLPSLSLVVSFSYWFCYFPWI